MFLALSSFPTERIYNLIQMMLGMKNVLSRDSWDFVHTHVGNLKQQIMWNILEGKNNLQSSDSVQFTSGLQ